MFDSQWRKITTLLAFAVCMTVLCADVLAGENATIVNGDVQLRESFPTFRAMTLVTAKLRTGSVITVIPEGSRVEVLRKKVVADQEWFETSLMSGARQVRGWVYAGQVGARRFVRLDPGVERRLTAAAFAPARSGTIAVSARNWFIPAAYADDTPEGGIDPPEIRTDSLRTTLFGLVYAVCFIGAMFAARKIIFCSQDPYAYVFSFLTGVFVLVIFNVVSESVLPDLIGAVLTPPMS